MSRALFVAGTGTDVGKTWVGAALIRELRRQGSSVDALKPVVSGFDPDHPEASDPAILLAALDRPVDRAGLTEVSPLQFRAPLAPPQAAAREGATLPLSDMIALCRERIAACEKDWLLIEGAGGVMSPIADHATGLDLMAALALPSVLVAGTYLGAISHTLTALEALRVRDLAPRLVLVSDAGSDAPPVEETRALIESFAAVEALLVGADHPQGIVEAVERLRR